MFAGLEEQKQQLHALNLLVLMLPNVHRDTLSVSSHTVVSAGADAAQRAPWHTQCE